MKNENSDTPAFPVERETYPGLTKRELIAAMMLQGLLSNSFLDVNKPENFDALAVAFADGLLDKLRQTN